MSPVERYRTTGTNTQEMKSPWRDAAPNIPYVCFVLTQRRTYLPPEECDEIDRSFLIEYPDDSPLLCYEEFLRKLRTRFSVENGSSVSYIDDAGQEINIESEQDFLQAVKLAYNYREAGKAVLLVVDKFDKPEFSRNNAIYEGVEERRNRESLVNLPCVETETVFSEESKSNGSNAKNETAPEPQSHPPFSIGKGEGNNRSPERNDLAEDQRRMLEDFYRQTVKNFNETINENVDLNQTLPVHLLLKSFYKKIENIDKEMKMVTEICQVLMEMVDRHEKRRQGIEFLAEKLAATEARVTLDRLNGSVAASYNDIFNNTQGESKTRNDEIQHARQVAFPTEDVEPDSVNSLDASAPSINLLQADHFELVKAHCSPQREEQKSQWEKPESHEEKFVERQDSPSFEIVSEPSTPAKSVNFNDEHSPKKCTEVKIRNDVDAEENSWTEITYSDNKICGDSSLNKFDDDYVFVDIDAMADVEEASQLLLKSSQVDEDDVKASHISYPTIAEMAMELPATQRSCQSQTDSDDFGQSFHSHTTSLTENDFYNGRKVAENKRSPSMEGTRKKTTEEASKTDKFPWQATTSSNGNQRKFEEVEIDDLNDSVHILPETLVTGAASIASMAYWSARDVLGKIRAHTANFHDSQADRAELSSGSVSQNRRFNFMEKIHPKIFLR